MKTQKLAVMALGLLATMPSFAQSEAGNGGRVWVCYNPAHPRTGERSIRSVKLLEYKEQEVSGVGGAIDLGADLPGVDDTSAMLEVALKRLERVDVFKAKIVREKLSEVNARSRTMSIVRDEADLKKILDANVKIKPTKDCEERQAAYNIVNPGPFDAKYVFIQEYIDAMSDTDRAGLKLHEAIYNYEASVGAVNSDGTRQIVRAISMPSLETFTPKQWADFGLRYSAKPTVTATNGSYLVHYPIATITGDRIGEYKSKIYIVDLTWIDDFYVKAGRPLAEFDFQGVCVYDKPAHPRTQKNDGTLLTSLELNAHTKKDAMELVFDKTTDGKICIATGASVNFPQYRFEVSSFWALDAQATRFQINGLRLLTNSDLKSYVLGHTQVDRTFALNQRLSFSTHAALSFKFASGGTFTGAIKGTFASFKGDLLLNDKGDLKEMNLTSYAEGTATLTDAQGSEIRQRLGDSQLTFVGSKRYIHLEFNSEGKITRSSTFRRTDKEE